MNRYIILLFTLMAFCHLSAQNEPIKTKNAQPYCGNDLLPQDEEAARLFNERLRQFRNNKSENGNKGNHFDYTIPVVIYQVNCFANKPDLITPQQAEGQIAVLNQVFNPHGIQFCLATKEGANDLPGDPLPGLIRVNAYPLCQPNINTDWANVVGLSNLPSERYLRIFVTNALTPLGIAGAASFPWAPPGLHGILISKDFFGSAASCGDCNLAPGYERGHVLVHEVGHYFGLYHTFEGWCGSPGDDCNLQGDLLCDTPPDALAYFGVDPCPANPALYACPGELPPLVNNFMTYTNDDCQNSFTTDQVNRMRGVLDMDRDILHSQDNLVYTGVNCTPTLYCDIDASNSIPCVNETVTFDNFPYNDATYTWDFGDMSPAVSGRPVQHSFAQAGQYTVTVTIARNGDTITCEHDIYVNNCNPINSSQGLWYFGLFGGLDFSTGVPVAELSAYNNFTIFTEGGSVVQADDNNDLLFYTDGINLYNAAHQQANSGQLFNGVYGSAQCGISVPVPDQPGSYYFFQPGSSGQLIFSVITNTGGGIALSQLNTPVPSVFSDYDWNAITAIPICDGSGHWVLVARRLFPDEVHVYRVNADGISLATMFSSASAAINAIKASPDGRSVVLCGSPFTVCDFDGFTGTLSNERTVSDAAYSASFSPNSTLVYSVFPRSPFTSNVVQHRVDVPLPATTEVVLENVPEVLGSMQLGPDGKIYVARRGRHQLGVVNYPDQIATVGNNEAGFTIHGPLLQQPVSRLGLPNFVDAGIGGCDTCHNQITVRRECRMTGEGRYTAHVTLFYQNMPIAMYNDPNCCVSWEYVNGIPTLPCPRPNAVANINYNPINLPQGQHYRVTIICGDCVYVEEDVIDCSEGGGIDVNRNAAQTPDIRETIHATVYPNPAKNEIAIRLNENVSDTKEYNLLIVDAYGRQVLRHTLMDNTDWQVLDISGFTPGVYAWYLTGADGEKVMDQGKIIVIP